MIPKFRLKRFGELINLETSGCQLIGFNECTRFGPPYVSTSLAGSDILRIPTGKFFKISTILQSGIKGVYLVPSLLICIDLLILSTYSYRSSYRKKKSEQNYPHVILFISITR